MIETPAAGPTGHTHRFRPDVEGLRAVAVLLVLWFHAGLRGLSGGFAGVDVFFVISGFLITGLLIREVESTGRISIPTFYARRAKRLLPAAATVLVATAALTFAFIPKVQWKVFGGDIASASVYVVNWRLGARSVDYLAEGVDPSPVQHFWSLAVEEQFYIVWPLLLVLLVAVIRWRRLPVRRTMAVGLALITVPSLAWSAIATAYQPASAYFMTTTRLWELGVGALVAVAATLWVRLPAVVAAVLGWLGLTTILVGALVQSTSTPWPGTAALVPTLGAAAVIISGYNSGSRGPIALLGLRPAVWIGGLSYSLYLWHWPMVVAATAHFGELGEKRGLAVVLLSFVPAWLTHRFVENPFRYSASIARSPRLALSTGLNLSFVGAAAGMVLVVTALTMAGPTSDTPGQAKGAAVLGEGETPRVSAVDDVSDGVMTPTALTATADVPRAYDDNCQGKGQESAEVVTCAFGDEEADFTVALVGDSKALQWIPALDAVGKERGWRIETYSKSTCAWTDAMTSVGGEAYTSCRDWGQQVAKDLTSEPVDLVVYSGLRDAASPEGGGEPDQAALVRGYVDYWERIAEVGTPVLALSNNPNPGGEVYECVAEHEEDYVEACDFPYTPTPASEAMEDAADEVGTAGFLDMDPWVCPGLETCRPVVGDVLIYRQGSHITRTYAETASGKLDAEIVEFLGEQDVRTP